MTVAYAIKFDIILMEKTEELYWTKGDHTVLFPDSLSAKIELNNLEKEYPDISLQTDMKVVEIDSKTMFVMVPDPIVIPILMTQKKNDKGETECDAYEVFASMRATEKMIEVVRSNPDAFKGNINSGNFKST